MRVNCVDIPIGSKSVELYRFENKPVHFEPVERNVKFSRHFSSKTSANAAKPLSIVVCAFQSIIHVLNELTGIGKPLRVCVCECVRE